MRRARVPLTVTSDDDVGPGHAHHSQRRAQVQLRHDAASEQEAQQHRRHLVGFVFKHYCLSKIKYNNFDAVGFLLRR